MCRALDKLVNEGWEKGNLKGMRDGQIEGMRRGKIEGMRQGKIEGMRQGKIEGRIEGIVKTYREFHVTQENTVTKLQKEFGLKEEEAREYVEKFWRD